MTAIPNGNSGPKRALHYDPLLADDRSAKTARIGLSQLSPFEFDKNISLNQLPSELLEKILNLVSLKTILKVVLLVDRFFYHLIHDKNLIPETIRQFKEELPQSFSRILESIPALSLQIFQEELKIKEGIIRGNHSIVIKKSGTKLKCLSSYNDLLLICKKIPGDGFGIEFKNSFLKNGPFLDCLMHDETIYALRVDGTILTFAYSAAGYEEGVPLMPSNSSIDRLNMQWPYLVGFEPRGAHIWHLTEKSLPPFFFPLEDPSDLIGISAHTLILLTKCEKNLISICFVDLKTGEEERVPPQNGYTFVNEPHRRIHAEITSSGVALLLFREADSPQEEPLRSDDSQPGDDFNGKNALDDTETVSLPALIWHFNCVDNKMSEYSFNFLKRPSHTAFYKDTYYCWNRCAGVVGAICFKSGQVLAPPESKVIRWQDAVTPPPPASNAAGLTWSLINGVVHTRSELIDLQSNTLVLLSSTLCANSFYALDYRKVTYLPGGKLLRGYPSCIEILDFKNPLYTQESTESSDST